MKPVATLLGAGLVALLLGGCTLFGPHIHDLTAVSVQVVPPRVVQKTGEARDQSPMLKITLRSKTDFVDIVQGGHFLDLNAFLIASVCTEGRIDDSKDIVTELKIYWIGGTVSGISYYREDNDLTKFDQFYPGFRTGELKDYSVFISVRYVRRWPNDFIPVSFDLEQHPQDICLAIKGGIMPGFYYQTNTVVVPKATIIAALALAPERN